MARIVEKTTDDKWQDLLLSARKGDMAALDSLVEKLMPKLYPVCLSMLRNSFDAEDLLQEALIRIMGSLDKFTGKSSFYTWAYRITVNCCLDFFRKEKRKATISLEEKVASGVIAPRTDAADPAELLEHKEIVERVQSALATVPEIYRDIVILFDISGMSLNEVAEFMNVPVGTVKSRLYRGRKLLGQVLREEGTLLPLSESNI